MDLVGLLITLIVFGLLFWLIQSVLPLPPPFKTAAIVILVVILVIMLLNSVGYLGEHRVLLR